MPVKKGDVIKVETGPMGMLEVVEVEVIGRQRFYTLAGKRFWAQLGGYTGSMAWDELRAWLAGERLRN